MTDKTHDPEWTVLLHGFLDDELDAANALRCEEHLASCDACSEELSRLLALRHRLRQPGVAWPAPGELRVRVSAALKAEAGQAGSLFATSSRQWMRKAFDLVRRWSMVPSLAMLAAAFLLVWARPPAQLRLEDEVVSGHVRSLLADHLTDVATSNQHVVKPWFNGRIDFSPPVIDLAGQGFPLVGGRVDYIGDRVVAALVYRRNGHTINLFVWPDEKPLAASEEHDGFNLLRWSEGGLAFWAVSDLNASELRAFEADFRQSTQR